MDKAPTVGEYVPGGQGLFTLEEAEQLLLQALKYPAGAWEHLFWFGSKKQPSGHWFTSQLATLVQMQLGVTVQLREQSLPEGHVSQMDRPRTEANDPMGQHLGLVRADEGQ